MPDYVASDQDLCCMLRPCIQILELHSINFLISDLQVNTLWGSFEISNVRLAKVMLTQFAGYVLLFLHENMGQRIVQLVAHLCADQVRIPARPHEFHAD